MTERIRRATEADLPGVERLLGENGLPVIGVADNIGNFVVLDAGDGIVGCAGTEMHGDHALLRSVAVRSGSRGAGYGRVLVERAIEDVESRGARAVVLLTTTATGYFPAFGFQEVPRDEVPEPVRNSVEFTIACPASAVAMMRATTGARGSPGSPRESVPSTEAR